MTNPPTLAPLSGTLPPCYVLDSHQALARHVAGIIAGVIRETGEVAQGRSSAVLGLPTGSTPVGVYRELIPPARVRGARLLQRHHVQS